MSRLERYYRAVHDALGAIPPQYVREADYKYCVGCRFFVRVRLYVGKCSCKTSSRYKEIINECCDACERRAPW